MNASGGGVWRPGTRITRSGWAFRNDTRAPSAIIFQRYRPRHRCHGRRVCAGASFAPYPSFALRFNSADRPVCLVIYLDQGLAFGPLISGLLAMAGDRARCQAATVNECRAWIVARLMAGPRPREGPTNQ